MYLDQVPEIPKLLKEALEEHTPDSYERRKILKDGQEVLLYLLRDLQRKNITVTDLSGPIEMLYHNKQKGASKSGGNGLVVYYTQNDDDVNNHCCTPLMVERTMVVGFGEDIGSLLNLVLVVAYFFPHLYTNYNGAVIGTKKEISQCEQLEHLGKELWKEEIMEPIIRDARTQAEAWRKRRPIIEQNIKRMVKTMR